MLNFLKDARRNFQPPYKFEKIIVFESDDWGAECISKQKVYRQLLEKGLPVDKDPYSKFDNIASEQDLNRLFNLLVSFKDSNGNHPVITANVNMGNPDYPKIKENNFHHFFWRQLDTTLEKYSTKNCLLDIWKDAIKSKIFFPQLHSREHLNVNPWLKDLRENRFDVSKSFEYGVFNANVSYKVGNRNDYRAAFDYQSIEETQFHVNAIQESYHEFIRVFGFASKSFIAPCYTWNQVHEACLNDLGVHILQGAANYKCPQGFGQSYQINRNAFFSKNVFGQTYLSRNVMFEPSQKEDESSDKIISNTLKQIRNAFLFGKPAIISMHRLNVIGNRVQQNADDNLKMLEHLLKLILKKWPDVRFKKTVDLV